MGRDKALARLHEQTLVELCVATMRRCFTRIILIANRPALFESLGLPVFPDDAPGLGPLGGLQTALRRAETPAIFVAACDMPFLNVELIREMAGSLGEFDAAAPKPGGRFEPLHAAYARRILPTVEARIAAKAYSVHKLLDELRVKVWAETELERFPDWRRIFFNVNTPAQLEEARALLESSRPGGRSTHRRPPVAL
jgi:molybdopterin-guanine dinucleotide biosynthesis protein A